jgi:hypothetical protein
LIAVNHEIPPLSPEQLSGWWILPKLEGEIQPAG